MALVVLCGFLIAGSVAFVFYPIEPSYRGKGLTAWLDDLASTPEPDSQGRRPNEEGQPRVLSDEATAAIQHFGPAIVPWLMNDLRARDSQIKIKFAEYVALQSMVRYDYKPAVVRRLGATIACRVLGPAAKPAMADLIECL